MHTRTFSLWMMIIVVAALAACGGGSGGSSAGDNSLQITSQPKSTNVYEGELVELSVTATGGAGLKYQWYKDGSKLIMARDPLLRINEASLADSGNYHVVVSRFSENVKSHTAKLEVLEENVAPYIVSEPVSIERAINDLARFSVVARGRDRHYQWLKNGESIPGATDASYTIKAVDYDDSADYRVEISNDLGTTLSEHAQLSVVRQRATGLWRGQIGNSPVDMVIPPSGEALMIRFAGSLGGSTGVYRGQISTREGHWWVPREEGEARLFTVDGPAYYQLAVNNQLDSKLTPQESMSATTHLYEADADAPEISSNLSLFYLAEPSQRHTSIDSLAALWRYQDDTGTDLIRIILDIEGNISPDSYVGQACAVSGKLAEIEQSTALFAISLNYQNRDGATCNLAGLQEQGYALILDESPMLALYLYSEWEGKLDGYSYLPLLQ